MTDETTYRPMAYTLELSNDEGERLIAALKENNIYGDARALTVIQEVVSAGRLSALPVAFRATGLETQCRTYAEAVVVPELGC